MYWLPSANPIGTSSICAALVSIAAWLLIENGFSKNQRARNWLAVLAPLPMLAFVACWKISVDFTYWIIAYDWWIGRQANTADLFACYILVANCVVLTWKATRRNRKRLKVLAFTELMSAMTFLSLELLFTYRFLTTGELTYWRLPFLM